MPMWSNDLDGYEKKAMKNYPPPQYRPEIDGLRAVAILSVVLYHAGLNWFPGGFVGVDVFFVISGYLITRIIFKDLQAGKFSIATFYERRLRRILPPLFFMSAIVTGLCWFYLLPGEYRDFGRSLAAMATFWANIFFYKQAGYFDAAAESKPLLHTWSLSVEEQFYIFLPLLMWLVYKKWRNSLFSILSVCAFISLLLSIFRISNHPESVFYLIRFRAWELLVGSMLAVYPFKRFVIADKGFVPNACSLAALLLLFAPVFLYSKATLFPALAALPVVLGAAFLIQLNQRGLVGKILATKIPVFIGKISYPLYLWHWPLLVIPELVQSRPLTLCETLISLSAAVILSVFSWQVIENPIRAKRILTSRKKLFAVSLACILMLVAVGRIIKSTDGWPARFSAQVLAYYYEAENFRKEKSHSCIRETNSNDFTPCSMGPENSQKPSFILWGDSHAGAWAPGVNKMAEEYGISGLQYTMSSCPPLLGYEMDSANDAQRKACLKFNEDVKSIIKDNDIKNVCLAATFGAYMGGHKGEAGELFGRPMDVLHFKRQLTETIDMLHQLGVTVWLVQGVPEYEYRVPQRLARTIITGGTIEDCALDYRDYKDFYEPVESVLKEFSNHDIRLLKITPSICNDSVCFPADERGAYYRDDDHLSAFGAKHFRNTFVPMFEAIRSENKGR